MRRFPLPRAFEVSDHPDAGIVTGWERHNATELVPLDCTVPCDSLFQAREMNLRIGRSGLAHVRGTPHRVQRDRPLIDAHPTGAIVVYTTLRGRTAVEHERGRLVTNPGQLLVCDADSPIARRFDAGVDEFAITIDRADLSSRTGVDGPDGPLLYPVAGPGRHDQAADLHALVSRSLSSRDPFQVDEPTVVDLVSTLAAGEGAPRALRHLSAARAVIARRLTDPALAAGEVADEVGISERQLSRLFADTGASVPQYVLGRRLDLAYATLEDPRSLAATTEDVAGRSGFTSMSHFAKTFQKRFDTTAGAVRRAARRPR